MSWGLFLGSLIIVYLIGYFVGYYIYSKDKKKTMRKMENLKKFENYIERKEDEGK